MNAGQHTAVWAGTHPDRVPHVLCESFPDIQRMDAEIRNLFFNDVRKAISTADSTSIAHKLAVVAISIFASAIVSSGNSWSQSNVNAFVLTLVVIACFLVGQMLTAGSPFRLQRAVAQAIADTLDRHGLEHDEMTCLAAAERIMGDTDSYWPVVYWLLCGLLIFAALYALRDVTGIRVKNNIELLGASFIAMLILSTITTTALYCFSLVCWILGEREISTRVGRPMAMLVITTIRASTVAFPLYLLLDMAMPGTHPH